MDLEIQRDREQGPRRPGQDRDRLRGMSHNERGLGVGLTVLVEMLDRGHFLAGLGILLTVGQQHGPAVDALDLVAEQAQHECVSIGR